MIGNSHVRFLGEGDVATYAPLPDRARKSHKGKQDPIVRANKQADLDMLELAAAAQEIDLKYLDESGFCVWSEPGYTY